MNEKLANYKDASSGLRVKAVLHEAAILHEGWEMDNRLWIVEMEDGSKAALTTDHTRVGQIDKSAVEEKLTETEASASSIRTALEVWAA